MKKIILGVLLCLVSLGSVVAAMADGNTDILKQGLLGAGVGAISSSASGGKAGKGALIGAGTNVIGGALLNTLMPSQPKQPQVQYVQAAPPPQYVEASYQPVAANQPSSSDQPKKHIIRKYDANGNVTSEEEVWE